MRELAGETLVYGLSSVVSRFVSLFLVPIYTRLFTPEDYGVLSLVNGTFYVVAIFVVLALDSAAHRWFWDSDDELHRKSTIASWAWCQAATSVVAAALLFAVAEPLSRHVVGRADGAIYLRLAALSLPLNVLSSVTTNWLRMRRRAWTTTAYALGTSLFQIAATLACVVGLGMGLRGVFVAQIAAFAVATIAGAWLLRGWLSPRLVRLDQLRAMLRFSMPLTAAALAIWVVNFSDRYVLQLLSTTAEVGLYSVGTSLAAGIALLTQGFQMAWGPFSMSIKDAPDARATYAQVFLAYMLGACGVCAGLALYAPEILRLLATPAYAGAASVVGLLALSYAMIGLTYVANTGPLIVKTTAPTGVAIVAAAIANVALNFLLVPYLGKEGSALATLVSQALTPVYVFYRSHRLYPIPYRFGTGATVFVGTLLVVAVAPYLSFPNVWIGMLAKAVLLVAIYAGLALGLRIVSPAQLRLVVERLRARRASAPLAS